MIRHPALAAISAFLLLGSIVGTTLAASPASRATVGSPGRQSLALKLARSYVAIVNRGMQSGAFSRLAPLYAPDATLTLRSTITPLEPQMGTRVVHGRTAITAVYRALYRWSPGLHWTQESVARMSPTVVEYVAHASRPGAGTWIQSQQQLEIRNGQIVRLDWILLYLR